MGAINKATELYEHPLIASKKSNYICPTCKEDVVFRKGTINIPHFSHKADSLCNCYFNPSKSQIHKNAQLLLKRLLDDKTKLSCFRECITCENTIDITFEYNDNTICKLEHKFQFNEHNYIADIVLLEDNEIKFIFEIFNTHKTDEHKRFDPWVEINAYELLNNMNSEKKHNIKCVRHYECIKCGEIRQTKIEQHTNYMKQLELERQERIKQNQERIRQERIKQNQERIKQNQERIRQERIKQNQERIKQSELENQERIKQNQERIKQSELENQERIKQEQIKNAEYLLSPQYQIDIHRKMREDQELKQQADWKICICVKNHNIMNYCICQNKKNSYLKYGKKTCSVCECRICPFIVENIKHI